MGAIRKVTVHLPAELLERAQEATGEGVTATVRKGLELVRSRSAYEGLLRLRGKVRLSIDPKRLRREWR
jgi:hypothetical protein